MKTKTSSKRLLSILLVLIMTLSLLPMSVMAASKGTESTLKVGSTETNTVNGDLDFSDSGTPLTGDGYVLDETANTLTLTDVIVTGNIILPEEDYTIVIDGFAKAQIITFKDTASKKDITIKGGTPEFSSVDLQGNLTIDGATITGGVSNTNVSGEGVLTIKNSTWTTEQFSWMTDGGIVLENSTLTIEEGEYNQFWTEKIGMDDGSDIKMGCPLTNYNNVSDGLKGIEKYLPAGYTTGVSNTYNTILDPEGNIASGISITKTTVYVLTVNLNGGNGTTNSGNYAAGDSVAINAGTKSDCTFIGWTSSSGGTFADAGSASTTFGMPAEATTITANWKYNDADYTAVDEALGKIPSDLSDYTDETVKAVNDAKDAVIRGKDITEQEIVDGYADAINNTVAALTYKGADYTAVDEALGKIPSDLSDYTDESVKAVNDAKNAVDRNKNITEQDIVDGYADAINDAVSSLVKKKVETEIPPQTGDAGNMALLITLMLVAGGAVSFLVITGKRKKTN